MGIVIENIERQIVVPTDIRAFITDARRDLSGTDYPGAMELGKKLAAVLNAEGFLAREIRLFSAHYVVALEDSGEAAADALFQIEQTLGLIDLKNYWNK